MIIEKTSERRTGRTTRMLRDAMKALAAGVPVMIVASTEREARHIQHATRDIGQAMNLKADPVVVPEERAPVAMQGWDGRVFVDHACTAQFKTTSL